MAFKAVQLIEIDAEDDGQRIDNFLFRLLKGVPKSRVYRILRKGEVRINGRRARPSQKLQAGDQVRVPPIRQGEPADAEGPSFNTMERVEKSIIYEDNEMLVLNKPAGIAVHGGSGISAGVIETLRKLRPNEKRLELVHRLDRGTSGCLMVARKRSALRRLQAALREKVGIRKTYEAVVHGEWSAARTLITLPLMQVTTEGGGKISRVDERGKEAETRFQLLAATPAFSHIEAQPVTGRTHQIRVHCATSGHPIAGDDKYDGGRAGALGDRLMLHASRLSFVDANGVTREVEAQPDEEFEELKRLYLTKK